MRRTKRCNRVLDSVPLYINVNHSNRLNADVLRQSRPLEIQMTTPWQHRFENHMRDGERLIFESEYREAFQCFKLALNEVPEPTQDHHEATRAVTAIADCYYFLGQYENAQQPLRDVLLLPDGAANPYIRLRRGQVFHHLGDAKSAATEWTCAFLNGGYEVFAGETDCKRDIDAVLAELQGISGIENK